MALSTIEVGGQSVTLVDMPAKPGFRTVQWDFDDPAAVMTSGFTGQQQVQRWPGADSLSGMLSLPPMKLAAADPWIAFLMALRGQANAFLLGDPLKKFARANLQHSFPVVDTSVSTNNVPGSDQLYTRGWAGAGTVFETGDWLQVGQRLYRNLFPVVAGTGGAAVLTVFPTIREQPADGAPIIVNHCKGLFRLAQSKRTWNADYRGIVTVSFPFLEWRGPASA